MARSFAIDKASKDAKKYTKMRSLRPYKQEAIRRARRAAKQAVKAGKEVPHKIYVTSWDIF